MTKPKLQKQLHRLFISYKDAEKAIAYFQAAEQERMREDSNVDAVSGLIAAGIIAYSRPFSNNENHERAVSTPPFKDSVFTAEDREVHKRIIHLRDKAIAHSDADLNKTRLVSLDEHGFYMNNQIFEPGLERIILHRYIDVSKRLKDAFAMKMNEITSLLAKYEG